MVRGISMYHVVICQLCNVKQDTLVSVFGFSVWFCSVFCFVFVFLNGDIYSYKVICRLNEII